MTVTRQRLHARGPELSRLVWGAWRSMKAEETATPAGLARFIEGCLELGITSFDHADIYGGYQVEALFGAALKEWAGDRSRIEIISKCGIALVNPARPGHRIKHYNSDPDHVRASVEGSLRALGTDYLDLLLIHRPDPLMDPDALARVLDDLVRQGKVRHVGVSNHAPSQIDLLQSRLGVPLVTNQIELSLSRIEPFFDGTLDHAQGLGMSPMAWSPLGGGGMLDPSDERGRQLFEALVKATGDAGQAAIAWLLRHPSRPVPVLGTCRMERLRSLASADRLVLERQTWFEILEAARGEPVA